MNIIIQLVLLAIGFVLLIKGADIFVEGASKIAAKMGIPLLVIGLTIVAMGTSAPEAAVSISAALKGSAEIAVGNVLGSNIMNILLILGIAAVITPLAVQKSTLLCEIPFTVAITVIFALLGLKDGVIDLGDGVILWALFLIYLAYLFYIARTGAAPAAEGGDEHKRDSSFKLIFFIVAGIALVVFGSHITVEAAKAVARFCGMSERLIGLTIVALGTSLPELVTSTVAAVRGEADIAIGNIIGSNIFNILFVIGTSALITPVVYQGSFLPDSIICVLTAALLGISLLNKKRRLGRPGGLLMLLALVAYLAWLIAAAL